MIVGASLLELVRSSGKSSVAVVGIAKNVGKTVTMRALYEAAYAQGMRVGLVSAGRDGETADAIFENPKPRLWLYPGTWIASAAQASTGSLRVEKRTSLQTACGVLQYGRAVREDFYELIGPPTAAGLRTAVEALLKHCSLVLIDGAIDRLAFIATGDDAVIVACGAAAAPTQEEVVEEVRALVERLHIARVDPAEPFLLIEGALTEERAAELIAAKERRQVAIASPAAMLLGSRAAARALSRLQIRCERTVDVVAATVASIAPERSFEPRALLHAVAEATKLPTYDVYAGASVGALRVPHPHRPQIEVHPERSAIAKVLGRDAIESSEFIVMRDELQGPLPPSLRVLREAPTYLLCEVAL
jgi:hypothetical protein